MTAKIFNIRTDWDGFIKHPRRKTSLEIYYGRHWRDKNMDWMNWKVAWMKTTGELYAVEVGSTSPRRYFMVLTVLHQRSDVEKLLEGWDHPDNPIYRDLDELMERIQRKEAK